MIARSSHGACLDPETRDEPLSKSRHSRNQWKHKATSEPIKIATDVSNLLGQTRSRPCHHSAQRAQLVCATLRPRQGLAVPSKVDMVFFALPLVLVPRIGFRPSLVPQFIAGPGIQKAPALKRLSTGDETLDCAPPIGRMLKA